MQFAGFLRGKALQEWSLMSQSEHRTYKSAITGLKTRLHPGNKTLAVLDILDISHKRNPRVSLISSEG